MKEQALAWLVKRPFFYDLLRGLLRLYFSREENPAFWIWASHLLRTHKQAFSRTKPTIWINAFFPTELIYSMGGVPIHPEILSSLMAYFNISGRFLGEADARVSTDLCSFYRVALGMAMRDYLPRPDLLISSSDLCDGSNKFFGYLSRYYGVPHLFLDVPCRGTAQAKRYLRNQLQELVREMERLTRVNLRPDRIAKIFQFSNQAREYLVEINQFRRVRPAPFPGSEALSYGGGMIFCSLGTWEGFTFHRMLHHFIKDRVIRGRGYLAKERYRLLWLHHIRPYYPNRIFETLETRGAAVVFDEVSHVYWPPLDAGDFFESLSTKILSNFAKGPLDRRIHVALETIKNYEIDGVIHFCHWGCRQSCGGSPVIADVLRAKGIPCLLLHGDGADAGNFSSGQTLTRLEAFVEMLDQSPWVRP